MRGPHTSCHAFDAVLPGPSLNSYTLNPPCVCRSSALEYLLQFYQQRTFDKELSQVKAHSFTDLAEYFLTQASAADP